MSTERLTIEDERFLINRLIAQAPRHTMVREFFMNAQENAALAPEGKRLVRIYPTEIDGVRKLTFWNTGPGMNAEELRRMTNLSSSINKQMSLSENFGIGAKVSGLTVSPSGLRYRSCKDGTVHQVTIGYDDAAGTFVRLPITNPDGSVTTVGDVTALAQSEGADTSLEWTELVLMGEDAAHDTVLRPVGRKVRVSHLYVGTQIYQRFAELRPGVEVQIEQSMARPALVPEGQDYATLLTLDELLPQLKQSEIVTCPETGVQIRYIHDPLNKAGTMTKSELVNPCAAVATFGALVHKSERYDFRTRKAWSGIAPNFGIPFGAEVLTVEVILPQDVALPNQYRDGLTEIQDRTPLTVDLFAPLVKKLMPAWVLDVIRSCHPVSNESLEDLQSELQKIMDEFEIPPTVRLVPVPKRKAAPEPVAEPAPTPEAPEAEPMPEVAADLPPEMPAEMPPVEDVTPPETPPEDQRETPPQAPVSPPSGDPIPSSELPSAEDLPDPETEEVEYEQVEVYEQAPLLEILREKADIEAKGLKNRAARFYKEAQTVFVNGDYPAVKRMAKRLSGEFTGRGRKEIVEALATQAAQRTMALRVGKAACYALTKEYDDSWNHPSVQRVLSPEALSLAADDFEQSMSSARKWIESELRTLAAANE